MTEQTENKVKDEAKLMCDKWGISNNETREGYMLGYTQGAFKYRDLIWHEATQTPQNGKTLLAINEAGTPFICGPNNTEWEETVKVFRIAKWCYIKDLL